MENQVCVWEEKLRIEEQRKYVGRDEGKWIGTYMEKRK
jgi:hypothetical protein